MPLRGFDAVILDGVDYFVRNEVRLVIVDRDRHAILGSDGRWHEDPDVPGEASLPVDQIGLVIPRGSLEAIAEAIARAGGSGDARTEVRVLREWLKTERDRVDLALKAGG